ncbi:MULTISPECIES: ABC transporter substrate-binding protein [unclassified Vibrio]|uniref:ABC transporter substrate-binding protein n=1 Tax=unclassified Vibrio TaxID=2614977 RepID=UPI001483779D|nr:MULTISPECIES: ABC transporter substrate-binding protein [unclassified Vibrio]NNN43822.1 ABC transporter substrate-binding protein [Vibrio sp. 1-1(7)]NNN71646.1 ABC transporter substrate-binding protein [Vibrio sp. 12-2(3-a)]
MRKLLSFCLACLLSFFAQAQSWSEVVEDAKGQTVYFHAWGGSQEVNQYLRWAAQQLKTQYGVKLVHVKVTDIAETTSRLIAEKTAGQNKLGSVDLVWINGANFKSMKSNHLLYGPFVQQLPNWQLVDQSLPVNEDFSEPTEGLEAPWGVGQLVFIYDRHRLNNPPQSFAELLSYAQAFPYRITYPRPPEFHGVSFLKALLIELTHHDPSLALPVDDASFPLITAPLWNYLDKLHAVAWRSGKQFPSGSAEMIQLLDDKQIDLAVTFNPNAVYAAQASGKLSKNTASYAMDMGALTNIHFLAIPWNATAKPGALVTINFLLSAEAQSHKGDLTIWGDPSVIQAQYLKTTPYNSIRYPSIAEPHPSWQTTLAQAWQKRYGQAK